MNKANKLQDSFRGRLMFPICDTRGEPVGFGGRTLDATTARSTRTRAETPLYQKSGCSTACNWAKGEIVARGEVVICEGYTDVMAFALAGVPNAVATCGTALADDHFLTLKNLARKVCSRTTPTPPARPRPSAATSGSSASRCSSRSPTSRRVAIPPTSGATIPQRSSQRGRAAPRRSSSSASTGCSRAADLVDARGPRARGASAARRSIAEHPNDLVRDQYVMKLAGRLDIDPDRLRDAVGATCAREPHVAVRVRRAPPTPRAASRRRVDRRELDALRWAVHDARAR